MVAQKGKDQVIEVSSDGTTWLIIPASTTGEIGTTYTEIDLSTIANIDGAKTYMTGMYEWGTTFEVITITGSALHKMFHNAKTSGDELTLRFKPDGTFIAHQGKFIVPSATMHGEMDDKMQLTVVVKGTGPVTPKTI